MKWAKKFCKFAIKAFLIYTVFILTMRVCYKQTDGFMLSKVQSDFTFDPRWEHPPLPKEELDHVKDLLSQKYYYLARGGQCYAFISQDQTTILKLLNIKHMRESKWLNSLPIPHVIDFRRLRFLRDRPRIHLQAFTSYKIAYEEIKEDTGIFFSHLNKTDFLHKKVTIYDKIGIRYELDLDKTEFILQKKAEYTYPKITRLLESGDIEGAKKCIDSVFTLLLSHYKMGIDNQDAVVRKNLGFIGEKAIAIDLGQFYKNEEVKKRPVYREKFLLQTVKFKKWIEENHPILYPYLLQKTHELLEDDPS